MLDLLHIGVSIGFPVFVKYSSQGELSSANKKKISTGALRAGALQVRCAGDSGHFDLFERCSLFKYGILSICGNTGFLVGL